MTTPATFQLLTIQADGEVQSADLTSMMQQIDETTPEIELTPGVVVLNDLEDVTIAAPEQMQVLFYDAESSVFKNENLVEGALSDKDVIRWNDSQSYFEPAPWSVFPDNEFTIQEESDSTKQVQFDLSEISSAQTRSVTVPDRDGSIQYQIKNVDDVSVSFTNASNHESGSIVILSAGFGLAKTITLDNTVPIGTHLTFILRGSGAATFAAPLGVNIHSLVGGSPRIESLNQQATAIYMKANEWFVYGDITAAAPSI